MTPDRPRHRLADRPQLGSIDSKKAGRRQSQYHQAFERGVKLIGATIHYVTATLDEGPSSTQHQLDDHPDPD